MLDIVFVLGLTAWSALVGLAILRRLGGVPSDRVDAIALAVPLGFGTLALAALVLGEIGSLDRAGFGVVFGVGALISLILLIGSHRDAEPRRGDMAASPVSPLRGCISRLTSRSRGSRPGLYDAALSGLDARAGVAWQCRSQRSASLLDLAFDLALALAVVGTFLTALSPVTDGDALCYHLQVPKVFLLKHAMTFDPDLHETVYPLVTEMLYAVALAFRGPVACRLIQWVLGLTFAANVTAMARPSLGPRARWAGTIALLVPAISNGMGAPLNDVALAAFGNAALVAVLFWRDRPTAGRAVLAGILAGMAIGVKYPALVWAGVLGVAMVFAPRARTRSVALFALAAILAGGAWYLRAYVHTGNPVYPFFRHLFGGAGIDDVLDPIKRPMAVTPINLLTALAPMTLDPDRFDSVSHQFGPAFLLLLPGLFMLRPPRRVVGIAVIGFAFLTLCLTQRQSMRFVLAAVGPFAVAAAWVASAWWERNSRPGRALVVGLVAVLMFESSIAIGRARHGIGVVIGRESADAFLARREPTYRVGRWIDANLPTSAAIIGQDHRGFYIPRTYAMELAHRRRTGVGTRGESPDEILAQLRRDGFTHLLTCPPEPGSAVEFDPLLTRRLAVWLADREPLYRESITDPDGVTRCYRIDALPDPANLADTGRMRR